MEWLNRYTGVKWEYALEYVYIQLDLDFIRKYFPVHTWPGLTCMNNKLIIKSGHLNTMITELQLSQSKEFPLFKLDGGIERFTNYLDSLTPDFYANGWIWVRDGGDCLYLLTEFLGYKSIVMARNSIKQLVREYFPERVDELVKITNKSITLNDSATIYTRIWEAKVLDPIIGSLLPSYLEHIFTEKGITNLIREYLTSVDLDQTLHLLLNS